LLAAVVLSVVGVLFMEVHIVADMAKTLGYGGGAVKFWTHGRQTALGLMAACRNTSPSLRRTREYVLYIALLAFHSCGVRYPRLL
jgi:hypothetical protein